MSDESLWDAVFAAAVVHMIAPKGFDEKAGLFDGFCSGRIRVAAKTAAALADSVCHERNRAKAKETGT
jgi:hypothetical protein